MPDQGAHILVIDDEPHARRISVRLLQQAGYRVSEAETGEEGLRQAHALRPDLILLDVVLPDLNGLEVCRRIKAAPDLAHLPVILLSGKRVDSDSLAEGLEGGANGYILRGTPTREFLARVAAWLRIQQIEDKLRWNEVIVSSISDPISYVDRDYVYRAVNETYCRYAQRTAREIVGRTVAELLGEAAFENEVRARLDRCFAGHEVHYQAWFDVPKQPHKYMDVGYYPVRNKQGTVVGAVVNSRDITERKQIEEALRHERDLVARIMETSPVGIVVLDREGKITFVNAQVEQVTGLAREKIVQLDYNDPTWQMVDATGRPLNDELLPFPRLMQSGEPIYDLQQTVELPPAGDGPRRLHLSMNAAPLFAASGEPDGVVISVQDVTERVHLQEQVRQNAAELEQRITERTAELEASQAELLRAERLAIAGKLAASLTHEISNPLQSVIGCLGLARETLAEGGDVREYLEIALPELRRVARIVGRLRNLGRPPSPLSSRELTDVAELMEQVEVLVRKQCQDRGITLACTAAQNLPLVQVVPDQIQQVFLNLTLNAIDAMPGGGRIDVRMARSASGVSVSFQDNGEGITREALQRVFDPFYSTKSEGLGLGLSISHEIVQQHGGQIEVESALGQGATFRVWLPI